MNFDILFGSLTVVSASFALLKNIFHGKPLQRNSTRLTSGAREAKPVVIEYDLLTKKTLNEEERKAVFAKIKEAFGVEGLGIIVVANVPQMLEKRRKLLPLARKFYRLDEKTKAKYEHAESNYSFGWSLGKEKLVGNKPDVFKGSYYNNPCIDVPTTDAEAISIYPESCCANIWPKPGDCDGLEVGFKNLGSFIVDTGLHLARHCDEYIKEQFKGKLTLATEEILAKSRIHKGRLLHYLAIVEDIDVNTDLWCQWHFDHSLLTGLVSAMYMREKDGGDVEIDCPTKESGLFIVSSGSQDGEIVRVSIPKNGLAFQLGQTMQVLSGGLLHATSHAVVGIPYNRENEPISRNTFAVFIEPNYDQPLTIPEGTNEKQIGVKQFKQGQTFGEFSKATIALYY